MTWRPSARIVRPGGCATANLRGMALQPLLAWPDSNINGGADYSVDFSRILDCHETIEAFEFGVTGGTVAWTWLFGTIATAYITWTSSGPLTVNVSVASSDGNTYQAAVQIFVSPTACLTPVIPPPRPGGTSVTVTDASMAAWIGRLPNVVPSGDGWWSNAGVPTFSGTPDAADQPSGAPMIDSAMMTDWIDTLPDAPVASALWWNNAGVPTLQNPAQAAAIGGGVTSSLMASWLSTLPKAPGSGWWNDAGIPTLAGG